MSDADRKAIRLICGFYRKDGRFSDYERDCLRRCAVLAQRALERDAKVEALVAEAREYRSDGPDRYSDATFISAVLHWIDALDKEKPL